MATQIQYIAQELTRKEDKSTGFTYIKNRYLILLFKCFFIRKHKIISSIIEVLLPALLFYICLKFSNKIIHLDTSSPSNQSISSGKSFTLQNQSIPTNNHSTVFEYTSKVYYSFNSNVKEEDLKALFDGEFKKSGFTMKKIPANLTGSDFMLAHFKNYSLNNLDYRITVFGLYDFFRDVKEESSNDLQRKDFDKFHEAILKAHSNKINRNARNYKIKQFRSINYAEVKRKTGKIKPYLFTAFANFISFSYMVNAIFVITSVCEEKKMKSFEFLKLMGATDGEIYFGHFSDHFLMWLPSFVFIMFYFYDYVKFPLPLPPNLVLILAIFVLLYFTHLIILVFLFSAPFKKYFYAEILFFVVFFSSFSFDIMGSSEKNFLTYLEILNPIVMLKRFANICTNSLSPKFNFKDESLYELLTYKTENYLSLLDLILFDFLAILIEITLTNYIIQVNPFQNGTPKGLFYFLKKKYWIKTSSNFSFKAPNKKEFEPISSNKKPAIILKNIDKFYRTWLIFGKFQVLKNFNFAVYEKQITVLLGHNGAGKTTTMNLIAGLETADNGSIAVNGIPVTGYSSEFKKALGYCPQENIFYDSLTVHENLKVAAILKAISFSSVDSKIRSLVEVFDLQSKLNELAKNLSGGMKRRLCLAIAVIGYNDVLVIDEPTSGLDPESRRKIWEILLELRKHKTILLTTHFLEEADVLGDSIAIMYDGSIKCCGSTIFLKNLYNVGYLFRLQLSKEIEEDALLSFIKSYVPSATFENRQTNEYFFRLLSMNKDEHNLNLMIAKLLDHLESLEVKEKFGIKAYGLTNTSLEDVFIKIGTLDMPKVNAIAIESAQDHPLYNLNRLNGFPLYLQQFLAILSKKFKLNGKNFNLFFQSLYIILIPLSSLLIFKFILDKIAESNNFKIKTFNLNQISPGRELLLLKSSKSDLKTDLFRKEHHDWLDKQFNFKIIQSQDKNALEAIKKRINQLSNFAYLNRSLLLVPEIIGDLSYELYVDPNKYPISLVGTIELFYRLIAREVNQDFNVNLEFNFIEQRGSIPQTDEESTKFLFLMVSFQILVSWGISILISIMFSFPFVAFADLILDEMNSGSLSMQIIAGLSKTIYWIGNLAFDFFYCSIIVCITCLLIWFFDKFNFLLPAINELLVTFTFASLNCLLVAYFIINLKLSKEITNIFIKWPLFITGVIIGTIDSFYSSFYVLGVVSKRSTILAILYKVLSPPFNVFDTFSKIISVKSVELCNKEIEVWPEKLKNISMCEKILLKEDYNFGYNISAYLISFIILSILIFLVNFFSYNVSEFIEKLTSKQKKKTEIDIPLQSRSPVFNANYLKDLRDPNVDQEAQLTRWLIERNDFQSCILIVHDLCKMFGYLEAVSHLSFTVKRGECFGLLGINGAGKTTTFQMIGGSLIPTYGTILLDGYSFNNNPNEYYKKLGYCPQENTHTNHITVRDNLLFFAKINGVPRSLLKKTVNTLVDECDLKEHQYKFSDNLSGGNKRKLSTAISLIGKKDLILLDEPTTGVDPVSRRKLWKTINFYKKQMKTSFILTSHSMDEVENLCSTISIMVAGQFKCLGTFSYLRDRYSQGFTIKIKVKELNNQTEYINHLKARMETEFQGNAAMKEFYMNTMMYIIMSKVFKWSYLFRVMEKIKEDFNLDDFLISETNLEQIFLSFTNQYD